MNIDSDDNPTNPKFSESDVYRPEVQKIFCGYTKEYTNPVFKKSSSHSRVVPLVAKPDTVAQTNMTSQKSLKPHIKFIKNKQSVDIDHLSPPLALNREVALPSYNDSSAKHSQGQSGSIFTAKQRIVRHRDGKSSFNNPANSVNGAD